MEQLIEEMKKQHEYYLDTVQEYEDKIKVLEDTIEEKDMENKALKEKLAKV